ncbi:hypothetical protein [Sinorhizobium medicae]
MFDPRDKIELPEETLDLPGAEREQAGDQQETENTDHCQPRARAKGGFVLQVGHDAVQTRSALSQQLSLNPAAARLHPMEGRVGQSHGQGMFFIISGLIGIMLVFR